MILVVSLMFLNVCAAASTITGALVTSCDPDDAAIPSIYVAVGACPSDDASLRFNADQQLELCFFCSTKALCAPVLNSTACVSPDSERSFRVLPIALATVNSSAPSIDVVQWQTSDVNTSCAAAFDGPVAFSLDAPTATTKTGARCVAVQDTSRGNETVVALYYSIDLDRSVALICLWRTGVAESSIADRNASCVEYAHMRAAPLRPQCVPVPIGIGTCMSVPARTGLVARIDVMRRAANDDFDGLSSGAVIAIAVVFGVVGCAAIVVVALCLTRTKAILSFRNLLRRRDAEAQADQQANAEAKKVPAVALTENETTA